MPAYPPYPPIPAIFQPGVDPFPSDPHVTINVLSCVVFYAGKSTGPGGVVTLAEWVACEWLNTGSVALADGQSLSQRGQEYLQALQARQISPSY